MVYFFAVDILSLHFCTKDWGVWCVINGLTLCVSSCGVWKKTRALWEQSEAEASDWRRYSTVPQVKNKIKLMSHLPYSLFLFCCFSICAASKKKFCCWVPVWKLTQKDIKTTRTMYFLTQFLIQDTDLRWQIQDSK